MLYAASAILVGIECQREIRLARSAKQVHWDGTARSDCKGTKKNLSHCQARSRNSLLRTETRDILGYNSSPLGGVTLGQRGAWACVPGSRRTCCRGVLSFHSNRVRRWKRRCRSASSARRVHTLIKSCEYRISSERHPKRCRYRTHRKTGSLDPSPSQQTGYLRE